MRTFKPHFIATLSSLLTLAALAPLAHADDASAGIDANGRSGVVLGISGGAGSLGCTNDDGDDCTGDEVNTAFGLALTGGVMLTPQLAVLGDAWGVTHRDDDVTVNQGFLTAGLRAFPIPRLWVQGGFGVAMVEAELDTSVIDVSTESDTVAAAVAGIGFEVLHDDHFGLDLQLRGGSGLYRDEYYIYNVTAGIGATWY